MRVLSGIQPSGSFHIGNYFAMMKKMIEYQENQELFAFIANLHAMTSLPDGPVLGANTREAAAGFLSLGLDPNKSFFWVQSDILEVTELTWVLSNLTPMGLLERCHSYKDKVAKGIGANHGLFAYPVLMAADILLYQSDLVPVGKDQKQHLEVARDIAIKFNNDFGETFVVPEAEIDEDVAIIPGTDGQKMSKSYGNTIDIFCDKKTLKKQVMGIVTDSTPVEEPKDPDKCNLFAVAALFLSEDEKKDLAQRYRAGGLKYGEVKKDLLERIWEFFSPYREKRDALLADQDQLRAILKQGADKVRDVASNTINEVRTKTGLRYWV
ncbi:MAG: tryptophan--tRNA ligase [Thermodesulfobacteriota bacterium]